MRTLQFTYEMRTSFANLIWNHHYTLKCMPKDSLRQKIQYCRVFLEPEGCSIMTEDSFHNSMIFGSIADAHDRFWVTVKGQAVTGLAKREAVEEPWRLGSFLAQSSCTAPGVNLKKYFDTLQLQRTERPYDKALLVMKHLEEDFRYCQGVTRVDTTAEEAWKLGCGVCQDWCHIMLGLCRMAGIPCRYVVGMLCGEGYSHAWVEIADGGYWYALDPTNHILAGEDHIKISHGRDYHDCVVEKGIFYGTPGQEQKIRVTVTPV